jgi:1-acyl-sn-glycerol-3-phosphate acyltransferase
MNLKEVLRALWYGFLRILAQPLFCALLRYRAYGRENIPSHGGVLIVSNHQSYIDPLLIGVGLRRQIHGMARQSLFYKNLPFRWLIESLNAFPLKEGGRDSGAIREAIRRLTSGKIVLVFPEGTRTWDGSIGELHSGIGLIAQRSGSPVVPAVIHGAYEAWPRTRKLFRLRPIKVAFGPPLYWDGTEREFSQRLRKEMLELQTPMRREEVPSFKVLRNLGLRKELNAKDRLIQKV